VPILDDFGMREFTPTQVGDLYELICSKFRTGSMIVTSNRAPADWYALFPNAVLAESALDSLVNGAHHVLFMGRSLTGRCAVLKAPAGPRSSTRWPESQLDQPDESGATAGPQEAQNEVESMSETLVQRPPSRARTRS
jgi:hypothetical protein